MKKCPRGKSDTKMHLKYLKIPDRINLNLNNLKTNYLGKDCIIPKAVRISNPKMQSLNLSIQKKKLKRQNTL